MFEDKDSKWKIVCLIHCETVALSLQEENCILGEIRTFKITFTLCATTMKKKTVETLIWYN